MPRGFASAAWKNAVQRNQITAPVTVHRMTRKEHNASGTTLYQKNVPSVFSTLHESLQQVLAQRLEWTELREVQEQTYSAVATGSDVLVIAPTAGGKSEAALIPVMDDILKNGRMGVTCLYISPLKALINDQEDRFRDFCIPTSLSVMKWHGDVPKGDRSWKDGEPPHFLMITPESLEVLLQEKKLSSDLRRVRTIIIDELHAFVESERGVHLKVLLDRMDQCLPGSLMAGTQRNSLRFHHLQERNSSFLSLRQKKKTGSMRWYGSWMERRHSSLLTAGVLQRNS